MPLYSINTFACIIRELAAAKNTLLTLNYGRKVKYSRLEIFQIRLDLNQEAQC